LHVPDAIMSALAGFMVARNNRNNHLVSNR
jgi:hypothetical protein